jgi:hypothetical protein
VHNFGTLEKLLCKDIKYEWTTKYQKSFYTLKQKLVTAPIFIFHDWSKLFHVNVDASSIELGAILGQPEEGNIVHPVYFSIRKLFDAENKYTATERKGLTMVYKNISTT